MIVLAVVLIFEEDVLRMICGIVVQIGSIFVEKYFMNIYIS